MKTSLLNIFIPSLVICGLFCSGATADEYALHDFNRIELTDVYYSEGANFGDVNGDGKADVVCGPYWFAGPDFKTKHEIYPAKAQPRKGYANNFFNWIRDFNGDGRADVLTVGFPGTPAYVYENPGKGSLDKPWPKHQVFDWVSNESPQFTNIVGDDQPELVCTRDGHFGYASFDATNGFKPWTFHKISPQVATKRFGHGLGVGDVDGDGRLDILTKNGWYAQPESLKGDPMWTFHKASFAPAGGADMFAYDVDGDGDNDVITSLSAHAFGLAWHEQIKIDGKIAFRKHVIMGRKTEENRYGVLFSELHAVAIEDIDGDGLKDIVTGKTYWSHHTQSPMWDAGAVVYWFKLVRGKKGVDWVPHQASDKSGIGRQMTVGDVNGDGLPDFVVGGMKGCNVLIHQKKIVDEEQWREAQPKPPAELKDGLSLKKAARHMTVPPGFRVQLAAGEPQIHQPIAFTIDPRGRLWVAEAHTYPRRAAEGKGKDKIIILEDTNGDGALDSRKVFIEGLNLVSGMEVGFGGVWVGAAPYLMFIPDADGDDRPDGKPQILLDGFGYQDTHETLNSFIWGPDGWLYGCHGVFTHSRVGKPGTPDEQRTPLNAGVWRYHPARHEFDVFARGTSNPWGVDFNDQGQAFITACVIPHLFHMIQGGRYQRQGGRHFNPHIYDDIKTIADHAHYVGNIRDHAWWGHEPHVPSNTSAAGGGHAHCGAMIYLADNWPKRYRNQIFFNNIHGNRVNCDLLHRKGSGFVGKHGKDLLLANDRWYRGINLKYGPDGSVYLIDWYDKNACHRTNPEVWDRTNGRIYNVRYVGSGKEKASVRKPLDLSKLSDAELVKHHLNANEWYVRMARRILQERKPGKETQAALRSIIDTNPDVSRKLRALWTLHTIGGLDESLALQLLDHGHESMRAWAIQLALETGSPSPAMLGRMAQMAAKETSPRVRLYLASALQRLPLDDRWTIAEGLLSHGEDATDHNLPLLVWYGVEPLVVANPLRALGLAAVAKIPTVSRFIIRRAASDDKTFDAVVAVLGTAEQDDTRLAIMAEILKAFEGRVNISAPPAWSKAYDALVKSNSAEVRDRADQIAVLLGDERIFPRMRSILANTKAPLAKRQQSLGILVRGRDKQAATAFQAVIADGSLSGTKLRGAAIRALASLGDDKTPQAILSQYAKLTASERGDSISTLVSRPAYALALFEAISRGDVPRTDLHAYHIRNLRQFKNPNLDRKIMDVWGTVRETSADKRKQIATLKTKLTATHLAAADTSNGRRLFTKTCATCHTLFGVGEKIGPDITGSNRRNLDYILENVVDPSAILGKDYRMTVVQTVDGRILSGLVQKETDSAITLRTINDTVVVAKEDIDQRQLAPLSLMPEQLLDTLKPNEVRDLIAYLGSPIQVALRGPRSPIDPKTGRVPGALEGESLKIVGKTAGNAGSQKMGNFSKDRWSGDDHLWWTGGKTGSRLVLEIPVAKSGSYDLEIVFTRAPDYAQIALVLDGKPLGTAIDLYNRPDVITTGVLTFEGQTLSAGDHKLGIEIVGAHPKAARAFMVGLDYVRLVPR